MSHAAGDAPAEQPQVEPSVTTAPARSGWSRIPHHLGRARTSTVVLGVLFVAILALYLNVRPETTGTTDPGTTGTVTDLPATTTTPSAPTTTSDVPAPTTDVPAPTEPTTTDVTPETTAPTEPTGGTTTSGLPTSESPVPTTSVPPPG